MSSKHKNRCFKFINSKGCTNKTKMDYHYTNFRSGEKEKTLAVVSIGKGLKQIENKYIAGWRIN